jgi:hypothetical protein
VRTGPLGPAQGQQRSLSLLGWCWLLLSVAGSPVTSQGAMKPGQGKGGAQWVRRALPWVEPL